MEKYRRSYTELSKYLDNNKDNFGINILDITKFDFKPISGILYSFFDSHSILISVTPQNISNKKGKATKCGWSYLIYLEETEIIEGDFSERVTAEYIAFLKAFQFLDTKLFIEQTKDRFIDESSDTSCLNMNWKQLNLVLAHKRKNLLTILDLKNYKPVNLAE